MKFKNEAENYIVKNYNFVVNQAVIQFYIKYYSEESEDTEGDYDYYVDIFQYNGVVNTVGIGDDYWSIDDVMIALEHNISKDIVHNRYSDNLDYHLSNKEEGGFPNLYNYYLQKGKKT